jgi:hypothetical protein
MFLSLAAVVACSSGTGGKPGGSAGTNGGVAGQSGDAGSPGVSGRSGTAGGGGAGPAGANGGPAGAMGGAGAGGGAPGGSAGASGGNTGSAGAAGGAGGSTGAGGGLEPGDTPPWRALKVTATAAQHTHNYGGNAVGMDGRAKPLGKLVVEMGVSSGTYSTWLGKRGFHVMGVSFGSCPAPNLGAGRDAVGTCRLGEFNMLAAQVKSGLASLHQQFPEEDWGYFLNQDGTVRWSDVIFTGMSHGATTAELAARIGVRAWRAVSRSGPRDNTCGTGMGAAVYDPLNPPFDPNCPVAKIASWLDQPSKTPIERFYALVGVSDVEYGDIMFNLEHTHYIGVPVRWNVAGVDLTKTNRFYASDGGQNDGHLDFLLAAQKPPRTDEVMNIAFGVPLENQNPAF